MLTAKQEKFAQGIAAGKDASAAYRDAYNCNRMSDKVVWTNACNLKKYNKVAIRIKELQRENENTSIWVRAETLQMLKAAAKEAQGATIEPVIATVDGEAVEVGKKYNAGAGNVLMKAIEIASKMCGFNEPEVTENKLEIIIGGGADEYAE